MSSVAEKKMSVHQALKHYFGFDEFKGLQHGVVESLLDRKDTFVIMPTGGGKSLCYQLPALMMDGCGLVISPLIALMKNQVDAMRGFGNEDGVAHFLNSSLTKVQSEKVKADLRSGLTKVLYVAPESLTKQENLDLFRELGVSFVAVDEAHCISEWGHDFRPEYRRIREMITEIGDNIPIIALTATATPKVQQDIQKNLGMSEANVFKASFNRPNLFYEIRPKIEPEKQIIQFIKANMGKSGIIYCLSRKRVEELAETLVVNGINALPYHAGFDGKTRSRNQDAFLKEDADVICATIAFGMGIDKPDVRFVMHYDMPKSLESYYQETGRAGRDGGEGHCIAFYDYKDIDKLEKFMQGKPVAEQEVGRQLLEEVVAYAETSMSRRKFLLNYFGEDFDEVNGDGAEMDDNSKNPKEQFDATDDMLLLMKAIRELKERYKNKWLINILLGNKTNDIVRYKHDRLETFGKGAGEEKNERYWMAVIRQALLRKLIYKEVETYGVLKYSEEGEAFVKEPFKITMAKDHNYEKLIEDSAIVSNKGGGAVMDEELLKMLKDLRKKEATKRDLAPYVIFSEPSLEDMANRYPITMDEMTQIQGVGSGKTAKFGKPFVDMIAKYVEENEIDRPQDMVVKSVVNKSGNKVFYIQNIDRKTPLDNVANSKGISMDELLDELERIIDSGTKLNLDYYIGDILDEDAQEELMDYFKDDSETGSLEEAREEFEEDEYSDVDIRLMRIKFMSEVAL